MGGSSSGSNSGSSGGKNSGSGGGKNSGSSSGSNSGVGVPESMSKREAEQMLNNAIRNEKTAHAKDKYLKVKASLEIMKHPESASGLNKTIYEEKLKELNSQVDIEKKALGNLLNA